MSIVPVIRKWGSFVRFSHTVFALPFALASMAVIANADAAGLVLGARVPIILTSRADNVLARMASCALMMISGRTRTPIVNPAERMVRPMPLSRSRTM